MPLEDVEGGRLHGSGEEVYSTCCTDNYTA